MFSRSLLLAAAILPLAACDSGPSVEAENATAEEVAAEVSAAGGTKAFISPGQWRSQVTIDEISIPGMPPEMAARMKDQMAARAATEMCLTPEDVERPKAEFFGGQANSCKYDRFVMSGGKIDMQMTCDAGGSTQTMIAQGTYSANSYSVTSQMNGTGAGAMNMKTRVTAERVGECPAA